MEYRELMPSDMKSLGLLGYVITVNKQVHSYQLLVLSEYLQQFALTIEDTVLTAILDGVETAIPLSVAIEAFSKENRDVQATLVSLSIQLSNIDSRVDRAEETLLDRIFMASQLSKEEVDQLREEATNKAITVRSDNNQLFKPPFKRNVKKSLWQRILTFIKHLLRKIFKKRETEETATVNDDYVSAIARCAEVAKDDFSVVCPAYDRILGICRDAISSLQTINSNFSQEIGLSAEIGKLVAVFTDSLTKITENQTQLAKDALVQKERTLPDFTISLIGRTKAGKSTLHSVLTNEGREKIGVGLQRTTRYNRVYQWNLLRLIDTPGIGSAEAEGRTDDQIAASVLGESDIICCVIVDDSIQQDILEFIEKIAALNKPIVILLNHKENIRPAPKFRKYIESPKDWLETTGEANLQGHINRILRYATDKGFEHQITVFPVFLLAALMAGEEEYSKYQETLWDSSNVEGFVHQLKKWIIEAGPIKRSQTLLDETIRNFQAACNEIESGKSVIVGRCEELKSKKPRTLDTLRKEQAKTLKMIETLLVEKYANLANQVAYAFAEENYNRKDDLSDLWLGYLDEIRFSEIVREEIKGHLNAFCDHVKSEINEVFEDLFYSLHNEIKIGKLDQHMQIDFKSITRILGGLLDVSGSIVLLIFGASNPVGWVLAGLGLAVSLLSGVFKSKAKKRQEAIDKVYQAVKQSVEKASPENISACLRDVEKSTDDIISRIEMVFDELISGLENTAQIGDGLIGEYQKQIDFLNKVYAWRIVQYLEHRFIRYSRECVEAEIDQVERINGKEIRIITNQARKYDTSGLAGVLAEKVTILATEEYV